MIRSAKCFVCLLVFFVSLVQNQSSEGFQKQKELEDPIYGNIIPEKCMVYAEWKGYGEKDGDQNPTEKWMAQPGLKKFYNQFKEKIRESAAKLQKRIDSGKMRFGGDFPIETAFLIGEAAMESPGKLIIFHAGNKKRKIRDFTKFNDVEIDEDGNIIENEDDDEENMIEIEELLVSLVYVQNVSKQKKLFNVWFEKQKKKRKKTPSKKLHGIEFYNFTGLFFPQEKPENENEKPKNKKKEAKQPKQEDYWFGLHKDNLYIITLNGDKRLLKSKGKPTPDWYNSLTKKNDEAKNLFRGYIDFQPSVKAASTQPFVKTSNRLMGFDGLKEAFLSIGLNNRGTVSRLRVHCNGEPRGFLGILGGKKPLEKSAFDFVKPSTHHVIAAKMDWSKLESILLETRDDENKDKTKEEFFEEIEEETGVHLPKFYKSLGQNVLMTGSVTVPIPYASWTLQNDLVDNKEFSSQYANYFEVLKANDDNGFFQQSESKVKGVTVTTQSSFLLPETSFAHDKDKVAVGFNKRTVAKTVINNKKITDGHLANSGMMSIFWNPQIHPKNGNLVAAGKFDLAPSINVGLPLLKATVPKDFAIPGTNFPIQQWPKAKSITNDLKPLLIGIYKTPDGFEAYAQSTVPTIRPNDFVYIVSLTSLISMAQFDQMMGEFNGEEGFIEESSAPFFNNHRWEFSNGLREYQHENGAFPAAYTVDEKGKKLLSWRVHLLPYLNHQDLYEQFHLNEPWDSEHNKKLLDKMPEIYSVNPDQAKKGLTTVLAVVGKDTLFRAPLEKYFDCPDGFDSADVERLKKLVPIIVVANKKNAVPWTAPEDWNCDQEGAVDKLLTGNEDKAIQFMISSGDVKSYPEKRFWKRIREKLKVQMKSEDEAKKDAEKKENGVGNIEENLKEVIDEQ